MKFDEKHSEREAKKLFESLAEIPCVERVSFGPSTTSKRSRGFTHGLVVRFSSSSDLPVYLEHPIHLLVKAKMVDFLVDRDFENSVLAIDPLGPVVSRANVLKRALLVVGAIGVVAAALFGRPTSSSER